MTDDKELISENKLLGNRPDGTNPAQYKVKENWPNQRWAWEFLRRNNEFINACEKVKLGTEDEKLSVAKDFWLKKFKRYSEGYNKGSGKPKFSVAAISTWSNLEADKDENLRLRKIKIGEGQVLIRFNLASAIMDKRAIAKQLDLAKEILNTKLKNYADKNKKDLIAHKPQKYIFPTYLRILDLLASGKTNLDCAKVLNPSMAKELEAGRIEKFMLHDKIGDQVDAAKRMAKEGYLHLLLEKSPNRK